MRVGAIGISFLDVLARLDLLREAPEPPYIPGFEVSGVIDAVGQGVPDFTEGDPVFALTRYGGYSAQVCVPHRQVFRRLEWMSVADGAALPLNYLTAYIALVVMGSLRAGDRVLIHAAAGGVGLAALDIARILGGETYGTATPHKLDVLRERGLDHPIDYRNYDYEAVIDDLTSGEGVALILDSLGGAHWRKNYRLLMPTGRLVHYGTSSLLKEGQRPFSYRFHRMWRSVAYRPTRLLDDSKGVMGVNVNRLWNQSERVRDWMAQIVDWYDQALFRPHVDRTFPFRDAADAHSYLQERKNIGKLLLLPPSSLT